MQDLERFARLAQEAYRITNSAADMAARTDVLTALGFVSHAQWSTGLVAAFTAENDQELVVCLRGTNSIRDVLLDLKAGLVPFYTGLVHSGGLAGWLLLKPWVQALPLHNRRLVILGHSLGGLMATYAAMDLEEGCGVDVFTFGSPKPGDEHFASAYGARAIPTTRVVHDVDIIPQVPPGAYVHVNAGLRLTTSGLELGITRGIYEVFETDLATAMADFDGEAEADHHVDAYVRCIQAHGALQGAV